MGALLLFLLPLAITLVGYGLAFKGTLPGLQLLICGALLAAALLCVLPCCGIYMDELKRSKLVRLSQRRGNNTPPNSGQPFSSYHQPQFYDPVLNEYCDLPRPAPAYHQHSRDRAVPVPVAEQPPAYASQDATRWSLAIESP